MRSLSADRREVHNPSMLIGDLRDFILHVFNANKQQNVFSFKSLRADDVDLSAAVRGDGTRCCLRPSLFVYAGLFAGPGRVARLFASTRNGKSVHIIRMK